MAEDFIDIECLDRFTSQSLKWLERRAAAATKGKPFFLYLPYTSPHKPVIPLSKFRGQGKAGAYGEFMIETDWHIGRILKWLDEKELAKNTMVIFTSDNGPERTWSKRVELYGHHSNGIYREGKRSIYEGGHRVPFLICWPDKVKAGSRWDGPVCQTDLLATFADMLDIKLPDNAGEDSDSFFDALTGAKEIVPRVPMVNHSSQGRFAVREGKWKLVMEDTKKNKRELFDLSSDPKETKNIISAHRDIESELTGKLTDLINRGRSTPGKPQKNDTPNWRNLVWMIK